MQLTENFTLEELVASATAKTRRIDNTPTDAIKAELMKLAHLLQIIRNEYGYPIKVTSGYRCTLLNKAVGGVSNSQHVKGQAVDIVATGGRKNADLFAVIKKMIQADKIKVGQLIWEYGSKTEPRWVHVSLPYSKVNDIVYLYS